jgi:ABC-type oligopeptide transport system substrate-binding subunit
MFYGIDRRKLADTLGVYPATRLCRRAVIGDNLTNTPFVNLPQNFVKTAAEAFDVAKANTYLDKALEASGIKSVSQSLLISETATHIKGACEIIMKQWEDFFKGKLTATIRPLPASQAQSARRWHEDDPTSFELALGSLLPSSTNVRNTFKYYISTYNPPRVNWHSDEYDALYDATQGLDQYNPDDIKIIAEKCLAMEKILLDEVVVNPVYERPEKVLIADNVHLPVPGYIVGYGLGYTYSTID